MSYSDAFFKALDAYGLKYHFDGDGCVIYDFDIEDLPEGFDGMVDSFQCGDFTHETHAEAVIDFQISEAF